MLIRQILLTYIILFTTFMHIQYIHNYLLSQTVLSTTLNNIVAYYYNIKS